MLYRLTLAFFLCALGVPAAAQVTQSECPRPAVTTPHPPPSPEVVAARNAERQACAADMTTFCRDVPPGCGRPMRCLQAHSAQLSAGCTNALMELRAAIRAQPH